LKETIPSKALLRAVLEVVETVFPYFRPDYPLWSGRIRPARSTGFKRRLGHPEGKA